MKYKLTICIATYNRAVFLDETLASILFQLKNNVEVVNATNTIVNITIIHNINCANLKNEIKFFELFLTALSSNNLLYRTLEIFEGSMLIKLPTLRPNT